MSEEHADSLTDAPKYHDTPHHQPQRDSQLECEDIRSLIPNKVSIDRPS